MIGLRAGITDLFILVTLGAAVPENDFGCVRLGFVDAGQLMHSVENQHAKRQRCEEASHAFDDGQHDGWPVSPVTIWQAVL